MLSSFLSSHFPYTAAVAAVLRVRLSSRIAQWKIFRWEGMWCVLCVARSRLSLNCQQRTNFHFYVWLFTSWPEPFLVCRCAGLWCARSASSRRPDFVLSWNNWIISANYFHFSFSPRYPPFFFISNSTLNLLLIILRPLHFHFHFFLVWCCSTHRQELNYTRCRSLRVS